MAPATSGLPVEIITEGLIELIGAATPVVTPIAVGTKTNTLGARP